MKKVLLGCMTLAIMSLIIIVGCKKNDTSGDGGGSSSNIPQNVNAYVSGTSVTITWSEVEDAIYYRIYRASSSYGEYSYLASPGHTSYTDNSPLQHNYYKVAAFFDDGEEGPYSAIAYCEYTSGGGGITTLNPPTNVNASVNGSWITLSWSGVSGASKYKVYKASSNNVSYSYLGESRYTSYSDNNPFSGDNYYKVSAVDSNGTESAQSSSAYCNYSSGGGGTNNIPTAPTNVSSYLNGSSIQISWSSVSNANSYKIYRSSSSYGNYSYLGQSYNTSYSDNSPLSDNYYKITAVNDYGESEKSDYTHCQGVVVTIPNAPTGVDAVNTGSTAIPYVKISWNEVSNATSYKVYRSSSAYGTYTQIGSETSYTTLYDSNPINGSNYYKVKAFNSAGGSAYSDYALFQYDANAYAPCPVHYTSHTATSTMITLRWSNPTTSGCGVPTSAELRVRNPDSGTYATLNTYSGSTTSASFAYGMWANSEGYVYMGIITKNSYGSSGGVALVYNYKTNTWYGGNGFEEIE